MGIAAQGLLPYRCESMLLPWVSGGSWTGVILGITRAQVWCSSGFSVDLLL